MPKVFIPQVPQRRDKATQALEPAVNINPAQEHGDLVVMLPSNANFYATSDLVAQLANHLDSYCYEEGDIIVAIGDPTIMAAAFSYLGAKFGKFKIGKWDRSMQRYLLATINVQGVPK